jgi:hypothetical protein
MDGSGDQLAGALLGALVVASLGAAAALWGGPRRRPAVTPGVVGGRVRLSSRSLERAVLIVAAVLLMVLLDVAASVETVAAAVFSAMCVTFSIRRGAFLALPAKEPGPEDHVEDGYVDSTIGAHRG